MQVNFWAIEKLIESTCWEKDRREKVLNRFCELEKQDNEFAQAEHDDLIRELEESQMDPLTHGGNYNQTDILKHLKKLK